MVGGYTQEATAQAERLKARHPQLRVHVFRNSLLNDQGELVGVGSRHVHQRARGSSPSDRGQTTGGPVGVARA